MAYQILDEPRPSAISQVAVNPVWPLLAVMFGGAWVSWTWSAINGFALGSPTRYREVLVAVAGFVGKFLLLVALGGVSRAGWVSENAMPYLGVGVTVWTLGVSYWLYVLQARTFGLWQHFGGRAKSGFLVVLAAWWLSPRILESLPEILRVILR